MFTLLVNATTMKKLLDKLGMSEISDSKKIAMANAVRQVQESNLRTLTMLKADRFLADADWDMAERDCEMGNPYVEIDDSEVIRHFRNERETEPSQNIGPIVRRISGPVPLSLIPSGKLAVIEFRYDLKNLCRSTGEHPSRMNNNQPYAKARNRGR